MARWLAIAVLAIGLLASPAVAHSKSPTSCDGPAEGHGKPGAGSGGYELNFKGKPAAGSTVGLDLRSSEGRQFECVRLIPRSNL